MLLLCCCLSVSLRLSLRFSNTKSSGRVENVEHVQVSPELFDWVQVRTPGGSLSCHGCAVLRVIILRGGEPSAPSQLLKIGGELLWWFTFWSRRVPFVPKMDLVTTLLIWPHGLVLTGVHQLGDLRHTSLWWLSVITRSLWDVFSVTVSCRTPWRWCSNACGRTVKRSSAPPQGSSDTSARSTWG